MLVHIESVVVSLSKIYLLLMLCILYSLGTQTEEQFTVIYYYAVHHYFDVRSIFLADWYTS